MLGLAVSDMQANMALATAVSGLRTAVSDLRAQRRGITLTEELGGTPQESVLLYANINRHLLTWDRSPASFGRAAELAVSTGVRDREVRAVRWGGAAFDKGRDT